MGLTRGGAWALGLAAVTALTIIAAAAWKRARRDRFTPAPLSPPELLETRMTSLWSQHVDYTAQAVVSSLAGLPDAAAVLKRLNRNQYDLAAEVVKASGASAATGQKLAALLLEHIGLAVQLVGAAAKKADLGRLKAQWYANATEIGTLLTPLMVWDLATQQQSMWPHLDATLAYVAARVAGDWAGAVAKHDLNVALAEHMGRFWAQGLIGANPTVVAKAYTVVPPSGPGVYFLPDQE